MISVVIAVYIFGIILLVASISVGVRRAGLEWVHGWKVWSTGLAIYAVGILFTFFMPDIARLSPDWLVEKDGTERTFGFGISTAIVILFLGISWVIIDLVFRKPFRDTAIIWRWSIFANFLNTVFHMWVVQPYLFEVYTQPTLSMAPALLGRHREVKCSFCGGLAVAASPPLLRAGRREFDERNGLRRVDAAGVELSRADDIDPNELMMCLACASPSRLGRAELSPEVPGDRFLVDKLARPQRWDIVVFRFPRDPRVRYSKRLIGLPGERIAIRDGSIWIDGRKADPPPWVARLTYVSNPARGFWEAFVDRGGAKKASVVLDSDQQVVEPPKDPGVEWVVGEDECFVIGDFSERSSDSRVFGSDEVVRPSSIEGVARYIYKPARRWGRIR